jgi:hypothetical protein
MNGDEALLQRIAEWLRAAVPVGVGVAVGRVGAFPLGDQGQGGRRQPITAKRQGQAINARAKVGSA